MPAITIFSMALKHLKKTMLEAVRKSKIGVQDNDVSCVITVPAIWNDAAKQFMREAALQVCVIFVSMFLYLKIIYIN